MWVVSEQDKGRFLSDDLIQLRNKLVNDGINSCVAPFFKGVTLPKSENSGIDCDEAKPYTIPRNLRGIRALPNKQSGYPNPMLAKVKIRRNGTGTGGV